MKRGQKIVVILLVIIMVVALLGFAIDYMSKTTIRAVIVKVSENSLLVDDGSLDIVGFTDEGNIGYQPGQEVLIFFNGTIMESYPGQLGGVRKIKIIKEKSDREISKQVLQYAYSSKNNVRVTVNEFTNKGITLTIVDNNEYPYDYAHQYTIKKKVENPDYTGVVPPKEKDTENSVGSFVRSRN